MLLNEVFQRNNWFRVPHWRWERVLKICDRYPTPGRCSKRDDFKIRMARNFLLRWRDKDTDDQREDLWQDIPGLYYAYDIHQKASDQPEGAMFMQARLLAKQSPEQIAEAMGTLPDTVIWYEALFFNVSDRLQNRDWITKHILLPAMLKHHASSVDDSQSLVFKDSAIARPFLDGSLKLFAYFGGTYLVDIMISGFQSGKPLTSPDDMAQWFDQQWSMTVRRRSHQASLQFEVNKYNVMELFATHAQIMTIEKSEENLDRQKTSTERHIKALIDEIPWAVGDDGEKMSQGTLLGRFDKMPAELRDHEVLQVSAGRPLSGTIIDMWPAQLPAPKKKTSHLTDDKDNIL